MFIFYPIAFPISKILDCAFGIEEDSPNIARNELGALMKLQSFRGEQDENLHSSAADMERKNSMKAPPTIELCRSSSIEAHETLSKKEVMSYLFTISFSHMSIHFNIVIVIHTLIMNFNFECMTLGRYYDRSSSTS